MKKFFKILGIFLIVLIILLTGGVIYYNSVYPDVRPAANLTFEKTADLVKRGEYIANHVSVCMDCHSTRDWTKYSGPVTKGTEGKGGDKFDENLGIPGVVYTKNITPAALGSWSDGEIFRAITSGVNKKGDVLFPMMPYNLYRNMAEEDVMAVIAYLRTLKPIRNDVPESSINFPVNLLIKQVPRDYVPVRSPDKSNPAAYGKYLVTIGGCIDCHSPSVEGKITAGKEFSGGVEYNLPFGMIRTANITPDNETGIGTWTKENFLSRFKYFLHEESVKMNADNVQTIMPWTLYAGMTEEDLSAIYDYLRTVPPVKNKVVTFEQPNQKFMNTRKQL